MTYYWTPSSATTPDARGLRGRPLRYLLVTFMAEARGPATVAELVEACGDEGVVFNGRASKIISDALRWEVRNGRVTRLGRGLYQLANVPDSTMRWIGHRVRQTKIWLQYILEHERAIARTRPGLCNSKNAEAQTDQAAELDPPYWWDYQPASWVPGWSFWPALPTSPV